MALSKESIGKQLSTFPFTIERVKVKEFLSAIGETSPIFHDPQAAQQAGFRDTPIPPTFQTSALFWGYPDFWKDMQSMGIDIKRLLHLKEEYTYHQTLYPGDALQCRVTVADIKSGKMDMVTFETVFLREGTPAITALMTIVVPPEASHE